MAEPILQDVPSISYHIRSETETSVYPWASKATEDIEGQMKHLRVKPSGLQSLQSRSKAEVRSEQCDSCKNLDGFQLGHFDMICASSKSFTSTDRSHSPRPSECKTCLKSLPPLLLCILCFLCALSFSLLSSPCPSVSLSVSVSSLRAPVPVCLSPFFVLCVSVWLCLSMSLSLSPCMSLCCCLCLLGLSVFMFHAIFKWR